jgi:anti-sigma factor RsiW
LYVEHDLLDADVAAVEAHLGACPACRSFLASLRASQAWVKDLAAEEIDAEALAVTRVRTIVAAARARRSRRPRRVPAWAAIAAAVVLAVGALVWFALVSKTEPPRTVALPPARSASPAIALPAIAAPVVASRSARSTLPGPAAVSPRMERAHVRRGTDRPSVVPTLSPDDADQLARAVVAIARIRRVDEAPADDEPSPAPLMRLATADPDVVIYWQLEPNGGN